jgi:hypothetical protein
MKITYNFVDYLLALVWGIILQNNFPDKSYLIAFVFIFIHASVKLWFSYLTHEGDDNDGK